MYFCSGALWATVGVTFATLTNSKYLAYASLFVLFYVLIILYERYFDKLYVRYPREWLKEYLVELDFSTEILKPVIEGEDKEKELTEEPAFQWWVTIIVGMAIIGIIVSVVIVSKFSRMMKLR